MAGVFICTYNTSIINLLYILTVAAKYDLDDLLSLYRLVKGLGMEKQDIINVLDFVKYNQLRTLQWEASKPQIRDKYVGAGKDDRYVSHIQTQVDDT